MNNIKILKLFYSDFFILTKHKIILLLSILFSALFALSESIVLPQLLSSFSKNKNNKYLFYLIILFLVLIILFYVKSKTEIFLVSGINKSSREKLFNSIITKYSESYTDIEMGNYLTRIFSATAELKRFVQGIIRNIIPYALIILFISGYMLYIDKKLGLISVLHMCCILLLSITLGRKVGIYNEQMESYFYKMYDNYNNKYSNLLNTYLNNEIKNETKSISKTQEKYKQLDVKCGIMNTIFYLSLYSCSCVFILFLFYYICNDPIHKNNLIKLLLMSMIYLSTYFSLIRELPRSITHLSVASSSYDFLNELVLNRNKILTRQIKNGKIKIRNVNFNYEKKKILSNVNLDIKDKEKIAIIGRSGSGKTTLMKLIIKLHKHEGLIEIDDININNISSEHLRTKINYINQKTFLLDKSILENIKYGNNISNKDIIIFLKTYNLYKMFDNLNNGVNEICKVGGGNLSLGMQKIVMLTRGLIKSKNSFIVIIDEPLSGLDTNTRKLVMKMIQGECKNKTLLIVTHDYEINKIVDRIINFNDINRK